MSPSSRFLACCLALAATLPSAAVAPPKGRFQTQVPGELIVRFRPELREAAREAQLLRLGAEQVGMIGRGRQHLVRLAPDADLRQAIARLEASGSIEYAHPNYYRRKLTGCAALAIPKFCPSDPEFLNGLQYHLHNPFSMGGGDNDSDIDMPQAWNLITGSSVRLAIIDDGFNLTHPDLDANLSNGARCDQGDGFCSGTAAAQSASEDHGTLVAGSAAAVGNNGSMVAGVALSADVLPIRMPNYTTAEVILAVDYAIAQGARIINMSFGGAGFTQSEVDAIDRARTAGILVVAAAGNEDSNTDKAVASYPANYPLDNILAAGASNINDAMASFSTWGSFSVDIAAPGSNINTTDLGGGTSVVSGTSFSSPITAGAAALIGQRLTDDAQTWDYRDLKAYLLAGADVASDNGPVDLRGRVAAGRLNVHRSLELVDSGLTGGVLTVRGLAFDDNVGLSSANDADGLPDPGETFELVVTLENAWDADSAITATLSTSDTDAAVDLGGSDTVTAIAQYGTATATFQVTLDSFVGNRQILFRLDLDPATGLTQTRYFYLEVGALTNGYEMNEAFQTTDWDEFHAWHANVPAGATNVVFETHSDNGIDIDLIARRINPPAYFAVLATSISSGGGTGEACDVSDPCIISGEADGEELIGDPAKPSTDITGTQSGTWHLVVVNFDQVAHTYRVKASWDAAGAGSIRFSTGAVGTSESAGSVNLQVVRSGGVGAVSVDYSVGGGSAGAGDFTASAGTLTWANGDMTSRTINVPIKTDSVTEGAEEFYVSLSTPTGGADIGRYGVVTITIAANTAGGGGGGGGGASDALLLAALAAMLAARRRRGAA